MYQNLSLEFGGVRRLLKGNAGSLAKIYLCLSAIFCVIVLTSLGKIKKVENCDGFLSEKKVIGVTGSLPTLSSFRKYQGSLWFNNSETLVVDPVSSKKTNYNSKWGVCTTISEISGAIRLVANLTNWKVVVVGDLKTPTPTSYPDSIHFLSLDDQMKFFKRIGVFIDKVPLNHFGRKNIGYLYAIHHGAEEIFDFDDDNFLKRRNALEWSSERIMSLKVDSKCSLIANPYPLMGGPVVEGIPAWPRGYPLQNIKSNCSQTLFKDISTDQIQVLQYLADEDPDVDGIYRLTRKIPFFFVGYEDTTIKIEKGLFVPFNAQATIFKYCSFWSLYLPVSVHGRVSDIWRSYIAERLFWILEYNVAFLPPGVDQFRNPHNPMADMNAEMDLYEKSAPLLDLLKGWKATSQSLPGLVEDLYVLLYEHGIVELKDVSLVQEWLFALFKTGYKFPSLPSKY